MKNDIENLFGLGSNILASLQNERQLDALVTSGQGVKNRESGDRGCTTSRQAAVSGHNQSSISKKRAVVVDTIIAAATELPIEDKAILLSIAEFESGFEQTAKNAKSTAYGVFQVIDKTWAALGFSKNQRNSLDAQVAAGVALYKENLGVLRKKGLGGLSTVSRLVEMYRLHHDGASGFDYGGAALARKYVAPLLQKYTSMLTSRVLETTTTK